MSSQNSNQRKESSFSFVSLEHKDYVYFSIIIVLLVILAYYLSSSKTSKISNSIGYDPDYVHPASL
jgi:hypothetical protein